MRRPLLVSLAAVAALAVVAVLLRVSVTMFGSWWRFAGAPTADEWSAFFGAFVVVGLVFAWYQLRQVDQSNRALAESNEEVRRVNIELVRPRVLVDLDYEHSLFKNRRAQFSGNITIVVRNVGPSNARDVRLTISPPIESLEHFFKPNMMTEYLAGVNSKFSGSVLFPHLAPGRRHGYFLGRFPDLTDDESGLPRRYTVVATYTDAHAAHRFEETFILDLDVNRSIEVTTDPVARLGKDVEVVGDELKLIRQGVQSNFRLQREQSDRNLRNRRVNSIPNASASRNNRRKPPRRR